MEQEPKILTVAQLAAHLHVKPETVRVWSRAGLIPRIRISRKLVRYDLAAVLAALTKRDDQEQGHA
ncbi:MAG: helix-turn-helix domain-containing protein [Planctomycetota bacterium]